MSFLVFGELRFLFEAFAAVRALKRLVTRVDSKVILQVAALVEFLAADAAHENRIESVGLSIYYLLFDTVYAIDINL